jgi:hypothetical protein
MTKPNDDLEAVRAVVAALEGFEAADQERILRWAREKLGLGAQARHEASPTLSAPKGAEHSQNIKSFVGSKNPKSDTQFAATVAYYHRFEAAEAQRKDAITATDLQDATRQTGRSRLTNPGQTLVNAHNQGYLDKAGRGAYQLNTVGENLVAMALPESGTTTTKKASRAGRGKGKAKKK